MLHIVSASPFQNSALEECLAIAQPEDTILLMADAVYAAHLDQVRFQQMSVAAMEEHVTARGAPKADWIKYIDYDGLVELTTRLHPIHTWY